MPVTDARLPSPGARRIARHRARQAAASARPAPRRHGLRALERLLRHHGLAALDQRSTLARELAHWRQCLAADVGGDPSTAQAALIERVAAKRVMVGALEVYLLAHPGTFCGTAPPALATLYRQMSDSLRADLLALGLERRAKDVPDLTAYLAARGAAAPVGPRPPAIPCRPAGPETPEAEGLGSAAELPAAGGAARPSAPGRVPADGDTAAAGEPATVPGARPPRRAP
jgi:hypothetical protein